ncbi:MAG: hypothetical protein ABJ013_08025 [Halioglobus sp.]
MSIRQAIVVDDYREVQISPWEKLPVIEEICDSNYSNLALDLSPMPVASRPNGPRMSELINDLLM